MEMTLVSGYGSIYQVEAELRGGTTVSYKKCSDGKHVRVRIQNTDPGILGMIAKSLSRPWGENEVKMHGTPHLSIDLGPEDLKMAMVDACRAAIQAY